MSGNSLASLLAWMKDESRLLGWGLVVALERRKINLIVLQEYIKRFTSDSYIPPIRGEVVIVGNKRVELIHDFVMDVPVISFENDHVNDSKAMLTMSVMGGSQLTLEKESSGWKVYKADEIDPLQGPKLYLDLLLHLAPGNVDEDGRVMLDLGKSDNFRLTFAESDNEQRMGGDFFKDLFNKMKPEARIYPLGKIDRGTNALMRPEAFELRTQYGGGGAIDFVSGCILALIRMEGREEGGFPGGSYPYLIPDDQGKDYSATVLFDQIRVNASVLMEEMKAAIQGSNFNYEYDADGKLLRAVSQSGVVVIPPGESNGPIELEDGRVVELQASYEEWKLSVAPESSLVVELSEAKLLVLGKLEGDTKVILHTSETGRISARMKGVVEFWVEFESVDDGAGNISLHQTGDDYTLKLEYLDFGGGIDVRDTWEEFWKKVIMGFLMIVLHPIFKAILYVAFKNVIAAGGSINAYLNDVIKLNFGQAIQGNEVYAPNDIGFFGRINPQQTSFLTTPTHPLIKQGGTQQFSTDPIVTGVQWKVETLLGDTGNPGTISASGLYQAPAATQFSGRFTRVRVTATAPGTGYHSSALVTIVASELSVHPLIQICDVGNTVELTAGVLGEDELVWSIKNAVPGESGALLPSVKPGGHYTYHQGPEVAKKTYVLDEIEVKNVRANQTRSVYVLAYKKMPMLEVRIDRLDMPQGLVQLSALFDGEVVDAEWRLALGSGSIDSTGLYRAAPTSTQRFALIFAEVFFPPSFRFEGHVILPLPLVEFPARLRSEHSSNQTPKLTAAGSHDHGR